jgi:hypothetical protein
MGFRVGRPLLVAGCLAALAGPPGAALADEPTADLAPEVLAVGVVSGDSVNLRVGPRIDDAPVGQLARDTVVLVVERAGDWVGVRVPLGFPAAVASALTEPVGDHEVRIVADRVNLRVRPPAGPRAYPAFRDHPVVGAILPLLDREDDWVWVEAPEEVRAYVHAQFVKELGKGPAEGELVLAARKERARRQAALVAARESARGTKDEDTLREEVSAVGSALVRLRAEGGYETAPVASLSDRLASALESRPGAQARTKALAKAILDDLEREIELRVAFHDELLASARTGTKKPTRPKPPAEAKEGVEVVGSLRWEAAPGWENGGAFVLWRGDEPAFAVAPAKDDARLRDSLKSLDGKSAKVRGKTTGARLLGLPLLELESATPAP